MILFRRREDDDRETIRLIAIIFFSNILNINLKENWVQLGIKLRQVDCKRFHLSFYFYMID